MRTAVVPGSVTWRVVDDTGAPQRWDGAGALTGAWRRAGRSLGGGPLAEPSLVTWLQAGSAFADLRRPDCARCASAGPGTGRAPGELDAAQAFSGRLEIGEAGARFEHDLDTLARAGADAASLRLDGDELVEVGDGYVERWRRLSPARAGGDDTAVLERAGTGAGDAAAGRPGARLVRVGGLAIAVWSTPLPGGLLLERRAQQAPAAAGQTAGRWRPSVRVGDQEGAAGLADAVALLESAGSACRPSGLHV